jgi:hypothetical protein
MNWRSVLGVLLFCLIFAVTIDGLCFDERGHDNATHCTTATSRKMECVDPADYGRCGTFDLSNDYSLGSSGIFMRLGCEDGKMKIEHFLDDQCRMKVDITTESSWISCGTLTQSPSYTLDLFAVPLKELCPNSRNNSTETERCVLDNFEEIASYFKAILNETVPAPFFDCTENSYPDAKKMQLTVSKTRELSTINVRYQAAVEDLRKHENRLFASFAMSLPTALGNIKDNPGSSGSGVEPTVTLIPYNYVLSASPDNADESIVTVLCDLTMTETQRQRFIDEYNNTGVGFPDGSYVWTATENWMTFGTTTYVPVPVDDEPVDSSSDDDGFSTGALVGVVSGSVVAVAAAAFVVVRQVRVGHSLNSPLL